MAMKACLVADLAQIELKNLNAMGSESKCLRLMRGSIKPIAITKRAIQDPQLIYVLRQLAHLSQIMFSGILDRGRPSLSWIDGRLAYHNWRFAFKRWRLRMENFEQHSIASHAAELVHLPQCQGGALLLC